MSPRKPTVDGLDDVDDEDGVVEDEVREETDLSLDLHDAEEVGLGGTSPSDEEELEGEDEDADWELDDEPDDEEEVEDEPKD
jgi:hypothetical protein